MPFSARRHSGQIRYRTPAGERGREDFAIDVRESGRTIRAYCEIDDDALTRDASWTLDPAGMPVEGHVRVVQGGELVGSSWYRFTESDTECESLTRRMGRSSQRLPGRRAYLGLHPLIGDGMIALARGRDAPGLERMIDSVTCSYDLNGETGLVALPIGIAVTYVGCETITVPAGTFAGDHYLLRWQPHWPPAKLWVYGPDCVFLRMSWEVSNTTSELVSFATGTGDRSPQFA
ncbi:MAG TPA: hypothetical protein VN222_13210 [Novosphingobium sp.]|nr:hypothetical protein [Novosphingobium sp.]